MWQSQSCATAQHFVILAIWKFREFLAIFFHVFTHFMPTCGFFLQVLSHQVFKTDTLTTQSQENTDLPTDRLTDILNGHGWCRLSPCFHWKYVGRKAKLYSGTIKEPSWFIGRILTVSEASSGSSSTRPGRA